MKKLVFLFNAFLAFCLSLIGYSCNNTDNPPVCMYGGPSDFFEEEILNDSTDSISNDSLSVEIDSIAADGE